MTRDRRVFTCCVCDCTINRDDDRVYVDHRGWAHPTCAHDPWQGGERP